MFRHFHGSQFTVCKIQGKESLRPGALKRSGIGDQGRARSVLLRLMAMAIENEVKVAAVLQIAK